MTQHDVTLLQQNINKVIRLRCTDGEVITARVDSVDPQDEEIVYEMLSTTDESKYEKHDRQPAYLIHFHEIASVEVTNH
jgi:small nuclear ribonucleoprotein (snRNP)-like protein